MSQKEGNDFIPAVQADAEEEQKWSFNKVVRSIIGVLMMINLVQLVFLGGGPKPS